MDGSAVRCPTAKHMLHTFPTSCSLKDIAGMVFLLILAWKHEKKSNSREGCDCARELKRCLANWSPNTHAAVELCQGSAASLLSRTKTVSWLLQEKERLLNASSLVEKNICSFAHLLFCYSTVILGPQWALPVARGRGARSPYQWGSV